jgi:hypothetical protein
MIKPVIFPEKNTTFSGDNCPDLPVYKSPEGDLLICYKLGRRDRLRMLFTGKLWVIQSTGLKTVQPLTLESKKPIIHPEK